MSTKDFGVYAGYSRPFAEDQLGLVRRFLIADVYARFLRAQGRPVLFGLGVEAFGEEVEREAERRGAHPRSLIDEHVVRLRRRFESLAISCDWERVAVSSGPEHSRRTQSMFLGLLERGLIYRQGQADAAGEEGPPAWFLRAGRFAEQCDLGSAPPPGWTADAVATQRAALGKVEGVEIRAVLPGISDLVVFTPYPDSIAEAAFVSVSPSHPAVEALAGADELARIRAEAGKEAILQTDARIAVPGVDELLPVVLAPGVDARFGPTAVIGMPGRDRADRALAERLQPSPGASLGTMRVSSKPSPSARYGLPDLPIARKRPWGTPVPIAHCGRCGQVPSPGQEGPERDCPQCGGPATPDPASIDWNFDSMWIWPSICSPAGDGETPSPPADSPAWTAPGLVLWASDEGEQLLWQRVAGHILGAGDAPGEDALFPGALVHGSLGGDPAEQTIANADDLDEHLARGAGDAIRFAILNSGAPGRATHLHGHLLNHAERLVAEVRRRAEALAERDSPLPSEIDPATRQRRRLAAWSRTAATKIPADIEHMQMHRATYDLALFIERIRAFEEGRLEADGLDEADRDAIAIALTQLGRLAEPLLPGLAAHLASLSPSAT